MANANFSVKKPADSPVNVGGVTPFTTIDYPGCLSVVVFLQGCPWQCIYCHNKSLLGREDQGLYRWSDIRDFLHRRVGLIDAVVFSGGEPTLHGGLEEVIREVRDLGFKVGLHSAGIYPDRLQNVLPLLDWIGLDIKALSKQYEAITGVPGSGQRAWLSAKLVIESGIDYEVRTTVHPLLLKTDNLTRLMQALKEYGVSNYSLQKCNLEFCSADDGRNLEPAEVSTQELAFAENSFTQFVYRC